MIKFSDFSHFRSTCPCFALTIFFTRPLNGTNVIIRYFSPFSNNQWLSSEHQEYGFFFAPTLLSKMDNSLTSSGFASGYFDGGVRNEIWNIVF